MKNKKTIWSTLDDATGTILEYVDITKHDLELSIGEEIETRFYKGIVTEKVIEEILWYQETDEAKRNGKKVYEASRDENKIYIKFLRTAF